MAYIDEVEEPSKDKFKKVNDKVYYSALVKASIAKVDNPADSLDQVMHYDILVLL